VVYLVGEKLGPSPQEKKSLSAKERKKKKKQIEVFNIPRQGSGGEKNTTEYNIPNPRKKNESCVFSHGGIEKKRGRGGL